MEDRIIIDGIMANIVSIKFDKSISQTILGPITFYQCSFKISIEEYWQIRDFLRSHEVKHQFNLLFLRKEGPEISMGGALLNTNLSLHEDNNFLDIEFVSRSPYLDVS